MGTAKWVDLSSHRRLNPEPQRASERRETWGDSHCQVISPVCGLMGRPDSWSMSRRWGVEGSTGGPGGSVQSLSICLVALHNRRCGEGVGVIGESVCR